MSDVENTNSEDHLEVVGPEDIQTAVPGMDPNAFADFYLTNLQADNINTQAIESVARSVTNRLEEYKMINTMAQDSRVAAILELYAQDITQSNDAGQVFWIEVSPSVKNSTQLLTWCEQKLDLLQPDKDAFTWALNLVKYGDLYVRLIKKSEYIRATTPKDKQPKSSLNEQKHKESKVDKTPLNEAINIVLNDKNERYLPIYETQRNPCEIFDVTQLGKTATFMKVSSSRLDNLYKEQGQSSGVSNTYYDYTPFTISYDPKKNGEDTTFYAPTDFVHASLIGADNTTYTEMDLLIDDDKEVYDSSVKAGHYIIKKGTGILNNLFKIWRELQLLETSVIMARLTRSNTILKIQTEIGDMDRQRAGSVMLQVKQLFEQKRSLNVDGSMTEYLNPGPIENRIYVPVRNGIGAISAEMIGNTEYDPKQLTDLDWFNNAFYAGTGVPKQYFNWTDDSTGFNGGTSLTIISSQYGRRVKRYQQVLCQMVTDMLNIYMLDELPNKQAKEWVNQFTVKMQAPTTQEEIDRTKAASDNLRNITDVMSSLNDLIDKSARIEILKTLLTPVVTDQTVIKILEEQAEKAKAEEEEQAETEEGQSSMLPPGDDFNEETLTPVPPAGDMREDVPSTPEDANDNLNVNIDLTRETEESGETTESYNEAKDEDYLPSFDELKIDGTNTEI